MSYRAPHSFEGPIRDKELYAGQGWPEIERVHAAKITLLDKQIGRLINKLKEMGELDKTLILFTSDNGPHFAQGGHDLEFFNSNGKLRGGKRDLYEGGIRVPLIAYWDKKIKPNSISNHISGFQDIMPTFSELIGIERPDQTDGISFLPTLLSQEQNQHEYLNWEFQLSGWFQKLPGGGFRQSVRIGYWKAVRYNLNSEIELYDINNDESETENLAQLHPDIIKQARKIFKNSRSETIGYPFGGVIQNYKSMDRFEQ
jgi:arylsulfatase A-like enzyme